MTTISFRNNSFIQLLKAVEARGDLAVRPSAVLATAAAAAAQRSACPAPPADLGRPPTLGVLARCLRVLAPTSHTSSADAGGGDVVSYLTPSSSSSGASASAVCSVRSRRLISAWDEESNQIGS